MLKFVYLSIGYNILKVYFGILYSNLFKCYIDFNINIFYELIEHSWVLKLIHGFNYVNLSNNYVFFGSF
jgi:hypothetical protein